MATKEIKDFGAITVLADDDVFHVNTGVDRKITASDVYAQVSDAIIVDASLSQKGIVQLGNAPAVDNTIAATVGYVTSIDQRVTSAEGLLEFTLIDVVGGNGMGVTTYDGTEATIVLGTPSTLTTSTTNTVTTTSHTHQVNFPVTSVAGKTGDVVLELANIWDAGTAASATLVSSPTDTTAGRVLTVGWMGQGYSISLNSSHDLESLPALSNTSNAEYYWSSAQPPSNRPAGLYAGYLKRYYQSANNEYLDLVDRDSEARYTRHKIAGTWGSWKEIGSGGGGVGGGTNTAAEQTFTSADQDGSSNIAVALDASQNTEWQLNFNGSPLPNTSGAYNIAIGNLANAPTNVEFFHIRMKRAGRKTVNLTATNASSASLTVSWLEAPQFLATSGAWDMVTLHRWPANPNILFASLNDGRV